MVLALGKRPFPGESVVANRVQSIQSQHLLFKSIGCSGKGEFSHSDNPKKLLFKSVGCSEEEACISNTFTRGKKLALGR